MTKQELLDAVENARQLQSARDNAYEEAARVIEMILEASKLEDASRGEMTSDRTAALIYSIEKVRELKGHDPMFPLLYK